MERVREGLEEPSNERTILEVEFPPWLPSIGLYASHSIARWQHYLGEQSVAPFSTLT